MKSKLFLLLAALIPFTVFSVWVVAKFGYFGFVELALEHPWNMQVLIDLVIMGVLFIGWMIGDARKEGIPSLPYTLATMFLGSIGALG